MVCVMVCDNVQTRLHKHKDRRRILRLSSQLLCKALLVTAALTVFAYLSNEISMSRSFSTSPSVSSPKVLHLLGNPCLTNSEDLLMDTISPLSMSGIYVQLQQSKRIIRDHRCVQIGGSVEVIRISCRAKEALKCGREIIARVKLKYDLDTSRSVVVCIECSALLTFFLRERFEVVVNMPLRDYLQAKWLHAMSVDTLRNWFDTKFQINIITTCRNTLFRLLKELREVYFFGDEIHLEIAAESTASKACLDHIDEYDWPHGTKHIRQRIVASGGPQVAIPEAIRPSPSENNYAIMLEDDVLISRQFFSWLKFVSLQLMTSRHLVEKRLFSISLYTPRVLETGYHRREPIDYERHGIARGGIFGFEVPCSWGAAFGGADWREALSYFQKRYAEEQQSRQTIIPGSRVTGWKGSWKKWLIELGYVQHWTTIYPIFHNETSFSTNMLMLGEHIERVTDEMRRNYTVPLFTSTEWYDELINKNLFEDGELRVFDAFFEAII